MVRSVFAFAALALLLALVATTGSAARLRTDSGRAARGSAPIPATITRRIRAEYGPFAYLPTFLPKGFIFTSWKIQPGSAGPYMDVLEVTFGHNGTLLEWSVSDGRDKSSTYADCAKPSYYDSRRILAGRLVYYSRGNHGDSAWTCLAAPAQNGYRQPVALSLWIGNDPGRPSPLTAMRMLATARR